MAGIDTYTKLMLHCDGTNGSTTFTDSSTAQAAKTVTAQGNAQISTSDKKFGTASYLGDGTGDGLTTPVHADFNMGSGDFTYDFWVKLAGGGTRQRFFAGLTAAGNDQIYLEKFSDDTISMSMQSDSGGGINIAGYTTSSTVNLTTSWHHLALVRSGSSIFLFLDGTSLSLTTAIAIGTSSMDAGSGSLGIMGRAADQAFSINGFMDEFRISKGIARWTSNFTPPASAYNSSTSTLTQAIFI